MLNIVWEELHSALYVSFKGGEITHSLLLFMAVKDAAVIVILMALLRSSARLRKHPQILIAAGILFSITIEIHALRTGRWIYADAMPLVPLLGTGLSPTVQIGLLAYCVHYLVFQLRQQPKN